MKNAKDRNKKALFLTDALRNLHARFRAAGRTAFPAPEPLQIRWAACALLALSILQLGQMMLDRSPGPRRLGPGERCRIHVQVGGPSGPVACVDRGIDQLYRAGLNRCCSADLRRTRITSGDRLGCRKTGNRCTLERNRMAPELLKTLQVVLNINTAAGRELASIEGIGPTLANRIVAFRKTRGPFRSLAGLLDVRGISRRLLERIRPRIRVVNPY